MKRKVFLRAVEPEDVDFILECERNPLSARWSDYRAPLSRQQLLSYALTYDADPFAAGQLRLIVVSPEEGPVGVLDLFNISQFDSRAYVGICIHPSFRSRGFGLSALSALTIFAFERLGLSQLVAEVCVENFPGNALFSGSGYSLLALLPSWHRIGNTFKDFNLFSLRSDNSDG